jgi:hypothetical protein
MEAARTSETSVDNYFTRQYVPEDKSEPHTRRRENLKSHIQWIRSPQQDAWEWKPVACGACDGNLTYTLTEIPLALALSCSVRLIRVSTCLSSLACAWQMAKLVQCANMQSEETTTQNWKTPSPKPISVAISCQGHVDCCLRQPCKTSLSIRQLMAGKSIPVLRQPVYSLNPSPCDLWLFPRYKQTIKGKQFGMI